MGFLFIFPTSCVSCLPVCLVVFLGIYLCINVLSFSGCGYVTFAFYCHSSHSVCFCFLFLILLWAVSYSLDEESCLIFLVLASVISTSVFDSVSLIVPLVARTCSHTCAFIYVEFLGNMYSTCPFPACK